MACNSSTCNSGGGCYKDEDDQEEKIKPSNGTAPRGADSDSRNQVPTTSTCLKCKTNEVISGAGVSSGDDSRFCYDCFRGNLFGKFRLAVTSNDMISPSDNVLVAFSGGPSSRVALQFVHEMQQRAQQNFDASTSRDRALSVFGVGVAFIDDSSINQVPSHEFDKAMQDMELIVSNLAPPTKELHVVPIENVCAADLSDGRDRLKELVDSVSDVTGKEDLLLYLRMLSLQKIASEKGYTKLILGSCTSRIACHVITATVKGQGYSLPADIQYVDSRWEIPVMLPLRDCLAQELKTLCRLDDLKTLEVLNAPLSGINGLISSFVALLQEDNFSRESTIVRTAGKLTPFHFNRIADSLDGDVNLASQRRRKKFNIKSNESTLPESFCSICNSPLNKSDMLNLGNTLSCQKNADNFGASCCSSCQFQILPKDPSSMEHFYSLLPHPLIARAKDGSRGNQSWLREQIQDFLLFDGEDQT